MKYLCIFLLLFFSTATAQVGINTITPSAELEIVATPTGIPALSLSPQTIPTGTATGQLAVIGDILYMYDETRAKWLTIEATPLQYNRGGGLDNEPIRFGGDLRDDISGPLMPFNGTIVYATARSATGQNNKEFFIEVKSNNNTVESSTSISYVAREFSRSDLNIDFDQGDFITARVAAAGGDITDTALVIWVKWRQ